jgi:hypothetical protein
VKWAAPSGGGGGAMDFVSVTKSDQSVSNGSVAAITWTTEVEDASGYHDNVTNTDRLTVPSGKGGLFLVSVFLTWASNSAGSRSLILNKNGSSYLDVAFQPNASDVTTTFYTVTLRLAAADYLSISVYQSSGVTLTAQAARSAFTLTRLGA